MTESDQERGRVDDGLDEPGLELPEELEPRLDEEPPLLFGALDEPAEARGAEGALPERTVEEPADEGRLGADARGAEPETPAGPRTWVRGAESTGVRPL